MVPDTASLWAKARRFEEILKADPAAYSFAPLTDIYLSLGLVDDALTVARKGCERHPGFAAGQMALAKAALENSLKDEAVQALEAVVGITPENIAAQRLLADLYASEGREAEAEHCLAVADTLDVDFAQPPVPQPLADEMPEEELLDADILELTDDLIEEEDIAAGGADPFAALPERPSLGEGVTRAEPYLLKEAPPLYTESPEEEQREEMPAETREEAPEEPQAAVASATIAELYISQGFPDKGAEVYRQLLSSQPDNQDYLQRLADLEAPPPVVVAQQEQSLPGGTAEPPSSAGVLETLSGWLGNIGRIRECRTKSH
jgi:tetratricopeptide (TPR) repeat protein